MDEKEATRTCGQCHREVAEANFALHETHCSRFLCLCPDCDESVPRDQLDQHRQEQHTQVRCSKCNQKMQRRFLMDHEADECVERLQSCQFCELELPFKELHEHSLACGSRTELCRDCGRYVTLRDQPGHGLTCAATDEDSSPPQTTSQRPPESRQMTVRCVRCMASFPADDIEKHKLACVLATRSNDGEGAPEEQAWGNEGGPSWLSSAYKSASLSERHSNGPSDLDQISTCPHCHLALPLFTLRRHQAKCQIHILLN